MRKYDQNKRKYDRITITVSPEEKEIWEKANKRDSLSDFIREAVNEYVKLLEPNQQTTITELILEQKSRLERIEGDLLDIFAAMAQSRIIKPDVNEGQPGWVEVINYSKIIEKVENKEIKKK